MWVIDVSHGFGWTPGVGDGQGGLASELELTVLIQEQERNPNTCHLWWYFYIFRRNIT